MRSLAPLATLALAGCLVLVAPDDPGPIRDLVAARARWNLGGPASYTFRASAQCFCVMGGREVDVAVTSLGTVAHVTDPVTGAVVSQDIAQVYRSVEGLFDLVDEAIRLRAHRIEVSYDQQRGFPRRIWIDWYEGAADDEYGFIISSLSGR